MEQRKFKVIEILALQSGTSERGEWKSQEVILEEVQNVQYPDRYLIRFSGEKGSPSPIPNSNKNYING